MGLMEYISDLMGGVSSPGMGVSGAAKEAPDVAALLAAQQSLPRPIRQAFLFGVLFRDSHVLALPPWQLSIQ